QAVGGELIISDDFWTTDGLIIQTGQLGGTFGTAWTSRNYRLEPQNGVVNGTPGWPYRRIRVRYVSLRICPGDDIQVTAKWGWEAVPSPVKQACLVLAAQTYSLKKAPLGYDAGFKEFGVARVK